MSPRDRARLAKLTWPTVMARWATHNVPFVTVVKQPEPRMHYRPRWLNKDESECRFLFENPTHRTGQVLADGEVMQTPEKFAAFALLATLRQWGDRFREPCPTLTNLAREVSAPDVRYAVLYWYHTARYVLPSVDDAEPLGNYYEMDDWRLWVDVAAKAWTSIAANYSVARWTSDEPRPQRPKAVFAEGHSAEVLTFPDAATQKPTT